MGLRSRSVIGVLVAAASMLSAASCTSAGSNSSAAPRSTPAPHDTAGTTSTSSTAASQGDPGARVLTRGRPRGTLTVAFAGDVHFAGRIGERLDQNPRTVFGQAAPALRAADFTMVNLETAVTNGGVQQNKEFTFRAPPRALNALKYAGIDLATMANNHGADYGLPGLEDSLRAEKAYHFPIVGIGANAAAAYAPYRTTLNGVKVAFIAADQVQDETTLSLFSAGPHTPGVANAYRPQLLSSVRAAKRQGYVVIVYVHWGIEYQTCPSADQTSLAGQLARAGASAVIGTHAHVLQGAGYEPNGTYVEYGLGNYLWWRSFGNDQDDNGVLTLTFSHARVTAARFAPSHLDGRGVPVPAVGAEKQRILAEWQGDRQCTDLSATRPH